MNEDADFLRLRNVTKTYSGYDVRALENVSLSVSRGAFVALVGPSGCGKTTLLNLIGGVDRPSSGQVFLGSTKLSSLSDEELTRIRATRIGYVFQFFNLLPTLTVEENVSLPLELSSKCSSKDRQTKVRHMLERVGMTARAHFFPSQLSGGEMQRTAIARALIHAPEIILADEPTGNLDTENGEIVLSLLNWLNRELGPTIVMATHSDRAASFASRIIRMRDGNIVSETERCVF